jgi:hypothetical protein
MFSSPTLSRSNKQHSSIDMMTTKRIIDEKCKTIEQLKTIIDELNLRHERKERELLKRIGLLYNDLQQNKKKMAHLLYKHQQQKKVKRIFFFFSNEIYSIKKTNQNKQDILRGLIEFILWDSIVV